MASKKKKIVFIQPTHQQPVTVREAIGSLPPIEAGENNTIDRLHITSNLSALNLQRIQHSIYFCVWKDVAPTITTQFTGYGTGRFGHPEQNRALTLREGAIIQTFPEDYSFVPLNEKVIIKDVSRQIGNAVPPRLGEIIGLSILKHYQKRKYVKKNDANKPAEE